MRTNWADIIGAACFGLLLTLCVVWSVGMHAALIRFAVENLRF